MASKYPTVPENTNSNVIGSMGMGKVKPGEVIPAHRIPLQPESAFIARGMRHAARLKAMGLRKGKGTIVAPIKPRNLDVTGTGAQVIYFRAPGALARKIAVFIQKKYKVKVTLKLAQESRDVEFSISRYDATGRSYIATLNHKEIASLKRAYYKEKSEAKGKIMPFAAWVGATVVPEVHIQLG